MFSAISLRVGGPREPSRERAELSSYVKKSVGYSLRRRDFQKNRFSRLMVF